MPPFKLLIVEDNIEDLEAFHSSLKRHERSAGHPIECIECNSVDQAIRIIDNTFDGAIVDMKLQDDPDGGNKIIEDIRSQARIPFAIFTGQPYNSDDHIAITKVFTKGKNDYLEILNYLMSIFNTGLTKIFGHRGVIEDCMNRAFWSNIVPQLPSWEVYSNGGKETEKALLRFTLNHIIEFLEDHITPFFEEEMYISPPVSENICTGSILTETVGVSKFLVMTPSCDLVIRGDGHFKTDQVLVCAIDSFEPIKDKVLNNIPEKNRTKKKMREALKPLLNNNLNAYYHWLPRTDLFEGGLINFRKINAVKAEEIHEKFDTPNVQISSHFLKNIVRRFSAFYSRQGQPDFDFQEIAKRLVD